MRKPTTPKAAAKKPPAKKAAAKATAPAKKAAPPATKAEVKQSRGQKRKTPLPTPEVLIAEAVDDQERVQGRGSYQREHGYSEEMANAVLAELYAGRSLISVCKSPDMPSARSVYNWTQQHPEFKERFDEARQAGWLMMAEELLAIADDGSNDTYTVVTETGKVQTMVDYDVIARSKLRVETRKWILSKMLPKVYGDKITQEHTGPNGEPLQLTSDQQQAIAIEYLRNAGRLK